MRRQERKAEVKRLLGELDGLREEYTKCTTDEIPRYRLRWMSWTRLVYLFLVAFVVLLACIIGASLLGPVGEYAFLGSLLVMIVAGVMLCCGRGLCWVDYSRASVIELSQALEEAQADLQRYHEENARFVPVMERFERFSADLADLPVTIEMHQKLGDFYAAVKLKNEKEG